jgi:PAS domain S-box-containing protein
MNFAEKNLRVLVIENSEDDFALIVAELRRGGYKPLVEKISTGAAMLCALQQQSWDAILCDRSLPQFDCEETLRIYKETGSKIPFIVISGSGDEAFAAEVMRNGAHDCLDKNNLARLIPVLRRELGREKVERELCEKSSRATQNNCEALIHSIDGIVWEADAKTLQFSFVSDEAERLLGFPAKDWMRDENFWKEHVHPDDRKAALDVRLNSIVEKKPHTLEYRMVALDGREIWLRDSAKIIFENEVPRKLAGVIVDITTLKQAGAGIRKNEMQLRQAQKLESIGQLAGGVAHDFNNILTIIQGHNSLMLMSPALSPSDREAAQQISVATQRASNLTRQLLTFSRRQIIQVRPLDLNEVVDNVTQMLRRVLGEDIGLETCFAPGLPPVFADNGMLEQILISLAINSRDAMPNGGTLGITTSTLVIDAATACENSEASPGQAICLEVTDNGCGIPAKNMPRIFEPFFTTKAVGKGTGLGLGTVYGIVKQHSGWIEVKSEVNNGTTFRIYFPTNKQHKLVKRENLTDTPRGGNETILVVEDETSVRILVKNILQKFGYSIMEAESGVAALKVWKQNRDKIHLLLTDLMMPDGLTGRELAEIVQFDRPETKVIYTSGYNAEIVAKDFSLHDGLNFLQKPYPPGKLAQAVRECLDEQRDAA